jgi:hypothetical protein
MHVLQLLDLFLLAPQIEIIETTLPESTVVVQFGLRVKPAKREILRYA